MNQTIKDIYEGYKYEMMKIGLKLKDVSLADAINGEYDIEPLFAQAERLEALIDLYAYLLACHGKPAK